MDSDIEFALAALRVEYGKRKKHLTEGELDSRRIDNIVTDLVVIKSAMNKIETAFNKSNSQEERKS